MTTLRAARNAMGTRFELLLVGSDPEHLQAVAEEALDEVERLDAAWSVFRLDSELSQVNRMAARKRVRVSAELLDTLVRAEAIRSLTNGAFDPAIGRLTHAPLRNDFVPDVTWRLPRPEGRIQLDPVRREVFFPDEQLQLDLGGIGKGYAIEVAAETCREAGVESGLIHGGTSTVYAFGAGLEGKAWEVGVPTVAAARGGLRAAAVANNAEDEAVRLLARVTLRDEALAVSARWGRYPEGPADADSHVIDPRLGRPVRGVEMAGVVAPLAADADALSTALLVGGADLQGRLANQQPAYRTLLVLSPSVDGSCPVSDQGLLREDPA